MLRWLWLIGESVKGDLVVIGGRRESRILMHPDEAPGSHDVQHFPEVEKRMSAVTSCLLADAVSFPSVKRNLLEPFVCTETIKHEV